jgi:hypothetical protein
METVTQESANPFAHVVLASFISNGPFGVRTTVNYANSIWRVAIAQEVVAERDWVEFSRVAEAWKKETRLSSSVRKKYASQHYKRIIGMGPKAVPLIIRQLELEGATPYHWWDALRELTGQDPVPPEVGGDIREVARIWIDWAHQQDGGKLGSQ